MKSGIWMQAYERVISGDEMNKRPLTAAWLDVLLEKTFASLRLEGIVVEEVEEECSDLD
jgi:hypothetical protein